ncbi:MAG: TetR/AcrR family transcriptional regulator [Lachnospiraceae bacterium]|nr:TetR/AcrR family transcriptional regulator [Lachnospiraceae bacterium]
MPKILEQPREKILDAARKRLLGSGSYATLTIRSIAKECGFSVGTVYNYFPSKDHLAASVMMEDWRSLYAQVQERYYEMPKQEQPTVDDAIAGMRLLFEMFRIFSIRYSNVFAEYKGKGIAGLRPYHLRLIGRIEMSVRRLLTEEQIAKEPFLPTFLAETLLHFGADEHTQYDQIQGILRRTLEGVRE